MAIPGGPDVALPDWAPSLVQVAVYVPHRTLAVDAATNTAGEDVYRSTFDTTTRPTSDQVSRLVADGTSWVTARLVPLNTASEPAAAVCAALYAAAAVERGWPDDAQALQRANDLEKRLDTLVSALAASNADANDADSVDYPPTALPVWSFPAADSRWDDPTYW